MVMVSSSDAVTAVGNAEGTDLISTAVPGESMECSKSEARQHIKLLHPGGKLAQAAVIDHASWS